MSTDDDSIPKLEERSVELTCRLCLKESCTEYRALFEFDGDRTIADWIEGLTAMKIVQIPETPSSLCRQCESSLEAFEAFRNECYSNDRLFSQIYLQEEALEEQEQVKASKNTLSRTETKEIEEFVVVVHHLKDQDQDKPIDRVESELESVDVKNVKTEEIPKKVARKRKSKENELKVETDENNKTLCTICNKFVARLNQHQRIHDDNPEFRCEYCNKGFHQHSNLKKHIRTHTKEKPYLCEVCDKGFTNSTELKVHARTHTQSKPFQCQHCHKAFITSGHLVRHTRTHTGEKPHSCDVCSARFSTTSHLIRHKRLHSQEYPFSCDRCDERFMRKDYLKVHKCKSVE